MMLSAVCSQQLRLLSAVAPGPPLTLCHPFGIANSLASVTFIFRSWGIESKGVGAAGFCHCPQAPMLGLQLHESSCTHKLPPLPRSLLG